MRLTIATLVSVVCAGCMVGPEYQRPVAVTPPALKEMAGNDQWKMATPSDTLPKGKWWEIFGDPQLNALEERINLSNLTVKQAEAQFREARALVAGNRANRFPTIGVAPGITQTSLGKNASNGVSSVSRVEYTVPADISWEPDLWGRVRLAVSSAARNAQVSAADLENLRLSQQALLAADYFLLAGEDMQQAVLTDTIGAYTQNLKLTNDRFRAGVASRSDITLAQTQLAAAQAQSSDTRVLRAQYEHAISTLIGQPAAEFTLPQITIGGAPPPVPAVPAAVPSQLLERRPDIAASERLVAAANANIGLAMTAYYPRLTLTASPGLIAFQLAKLFTAGSLSWTGSASLPTTVGDFGRRRAAVQGAQAAYDAAVAAYQQTVLIAFQEVEDELAALRYLSEEADQQREAVTAATQALNLELSRYRAGTDSYLNVIQTQTILLTNQQQAIAIAERRMGAAVGLIKALGGGWEASMLPTEEDVRTVDIATPAQQVPSP
jgi:NodT family efflux transporter outer membrane factor (OMF) lipoprotein